MHLPKSKYEILCAIVAQMKNGPHGLVKAEPIAKSCGYSLDVVLQNFGFFTSVGILSPGMNKYLSDEGSLLSYTLASGSNEKIIKCWRSIIDDWPEMIKILSWIHKNEGLQLAEVLDGAQAIFHRNTSSSRFALQCLLHLAHKIAYLKVCDSLIMLSEYATKLLDASPHCCPDEVNIECFPNDNSKLSLVPDAGTRSVVAKDRGEGVHIHLHFGSDVSSTQIESIFRSLAETVLTSPGLQGESSNQSDGAPITVINSNRRSVTGEGA